MAVVFAVTMLLMVPPYLWWPRYMPFKLVVYFLPQALSIAVPCALLIALAWSRPARQSRQWLGAMIAAGAICSAFCFVTSAWWLPSANQALRVSMARQLGPGWGGPPNLPELTIGELRHQVNWARTVHAEWRELFFAYYMRWAFPFASLSLALLLLALHRRGVARRWLVLAVLPIIFGYYALMNAGRAYGVAGDIGELTAATAAWLPNVVVVLVASAIFALGAPHGAIE